MNKKIALLKKEHHFLQDNSDDVLKSVPVNLIKGFDGFYQNGGFPKFKSRKVAKKSINNYAGGRIRIRDNRDLNASLNIREEGIRKELGRNNPDLSKHKSVEIEISPLIGNDLRSRKKPIAL